MWCAAALAAGRIRFAARGLSRGSLAASLVPPHRGGPALDGFPRSPTPSNPGCGDRGRSETRTCGSANPLATRLHCFFDLELCRGRYALPPSWGAPSRVTRCARTLTLLLGCGWRAGRCAARRQFERARCPTPSALGVGRARIGVERHQTRWGLSYCLRLCGAYSPDHCVVPILRSLLR